MGLIYRGVPTSDIWSVKDSDKSIDNISISARFFPPQLKERTVPTLGDEGISY